VLERASDFPDDGPILVITDGLIDVLRIRRTHAFLIPAGVSLPFRPIGPVFRFSQMETRNRHRESICARPRKDSGNR
jgi:hypothetical protein